MHEALEVAYAQTIAYKHLKPAVRLNFCAPAKQIQLKITAEHSGYVAPIKIGNKQVNEHVN